MKSWVKKDYQILLWGHCDIVQQISASTRKLRKFETTSGILSKDLESLMELADPAYNSAEDYRIKWTI